MTMLQNISKESKALILLEFTKGLLMHSGYGELSELKKIISEEEREHKGEPKANREFVREIIKEKEKDFKNVVAPNIKDEIGRELAERLRIPVRIRPRVLRIPESRLPERLQYLKPSFQNIEIDLGKLNSLIQDPVVRVIECNGPGERIVVRVPSPKYTDIILNKEEIDEIVQIFEKRSRIPATEGIYRVVVGKFIFSAIISEVLGSKFSINKITYAPIFR